MLKNRKLIIVMLLLVLISVIVTAFFIKKRYEQPEIKSLKIFGEKVKIIDKKKVYLLLMDSARIEYNNTRCSVPYKITFKNGYEVDGGSFRYLNGESEADFYFNASKKNGKIIVEDSYNTKNKIYRVQGYDVYIKVIFDKPLEVDSRC